MQSAVTICLVSEARLGPFVLHGGLANSCRRAAAFGFEAVEIFPASADAVDRSQLADLLAAHRLRVAAFGTGAGWLLRQLSLSSPDPAVRSDARSFIASMIELAAQFSAPAIIGSMQGRIADDGNRDQALEWLGDALHELGQLAASRKLPLLFEPLNRYETNLVNRLDQAADLCQSADLRHVRLLADLFHMNIEEADIGAALARAGPLVGHVHFADSNRHAVGFGHTNVAPAISALRQIGYTGYLSAEIYPLPTAEAAAQQTIAAFRRHCS